MPFVNVEGVKLHWEVAGAGHPVLFLHGHTLDHRLWDDQVESLASSYTVLRADLRGHGSSDAPKTGYSWVHYAADVRGMVKALGYRRVSIVGHSLGGVAGIEIAITSPDMLTTLTLVGSGLGGQRYSGGTEINARKRALVRAEGVSEKFVRTAIFGTLYEGTPDYQGKQARLRAMISAWSAASWLDETRHPEPARPQIERLAEIRAPTLVMVGEHERDDFHAIAQRLSRDIPVVRKTVLPEAGHHPPMENPSAFNDALLDFLNGAVGKALA